MRNQIDEAKTRCQLVSEEAQVIRILRREFKDFKFRACQLRFESREKWWSLSWHDLAR